MGHVLLTSTAMMKTYCIILVNVLISSVLGQFDPHFHGNRSVIVHLFEWKWNDIADECERFLQHKGYGGVQISPPNENVIIKNRPWWERYQPVSYIINTRSGDEIAFKNMTRRCNDVGVRIYADAVINHMAATDGIGKAGSTSNRTHKYFPGVPFGPYDFHDDCGISNYQDATNVRNCELEALRDLDHSKAYVRQKIIEYLNHLIDLGVAGFRIDAAKHMWPADLQYIIDHLKYLNTEYGFSPKQKPFIFQEVIYFGNEGVNIKEYTPIGVVTEFKHSRSITNVFRGNDKLTYLNSWGPGWGFLEGRVVVFVDNHDTQRQHGQLTYKESKKYKMANAFMLAHPYGIPKVMSSFDFNSRNQGPPKDSDENLVSPEVNSDETCGDGYICEHRWRQISNMVAFRNLVTGTPFTNWWSNGDQHISFCRGNKGFVAFTNGGDLRQELQTCLPTGRYCDVISGEVIGGRCSGKTVDVTSNGKAHIVVLAGDEDGVLAIHENSRINFIP
ncbi:unnamed protein product [Phaedon cochleariae]|uniref:Alpha-amylase n=1 Tax=Phaedon cochleariae TaxID=80249 RepID=A0A9P0DFQ4_PHACE|nr:unnamed protein product [Phaedon cochleariae]